VGVSALQVRQPTIKDYEILEASKEVFSLKGFAAATVDEIAQLAGVGKGTVYRHFGNKSELFAALLRHGMDQVYSALHHTILPHAEPVRNIRSIIHTYLSFFSEHKKIYSVIITEGFNTILTNPHVNMTFQEQLGLQVKLIETVIKQGRDDGSLAEIDTAETASLLLGLIHSVLRGTIIRNQEIDIEKSTKNIMQCFVEGIKR